MSSIVILIEVSNREVSPRAALTPVSESTEFDQRMVITSPIVGGVVVGEDENGGDTNVRADDQISEEHKSRDQGFIVSSGGLEHAVRISRVERESGSRETISNEVNPEELDGVEAIRNSEKR